MDKKYFTSKSVELKRSPEQWKDIAGYGGRYQVSSLGRVRISDYVAEPCSKRPNGAKMSGRICIAKPDDRGYSVVSLRKNGKAYHKSIHRLVAEAFLPNPQNCKTVIHKDGNPQNNTVENLSWRPLEWRKKEHLSEEQLYAIKELHQHGIDVGEISRRLKISTTAAYCGTKGLCEIPDEFYRLFSDGKDKVIFCGEKFKISKLLYRRVYVSENGVVVNITSNCCKKPNVLKIAHGSGGYLTLNYSIDNNTREFQQVHRLVADAFIPKIQGKDIVNHIDGNKHNNNVSNLEWCTSSENSQHALRTGLRHPAHGERHGSAKLTEKDVSTIRDLLMQGDAGAGLARKYNVSATTINAIKKGKIWKTA